MGEMQMKAEIQIINENNTKDSSIDRYDIDRSFCRVTLKYTTVYNYTPWSLGRCSHLIDTMSLLGRSYHILPLCPSESIIIGAFVRSERDDSCDKVEANECRRSQTSVSEESEGTVKIKERTDGRYKRATRLCKSRHQSIHRCRHY